MLFSLIVLILVRKAARNHFGPLSRPSQRMGMVSRPRYSVLFCQHHVAIISPPWRSPAPNIIAIFGASNSPAILPAIVKELARTQSALALREVPGSVGHQHPIPLYLHWSQMPAGLRASGVPLPSKGGILFLYNPLTIFCPGEVVESTEAPGSWKLTTLMFGSKNDQDERGEDGQGGADFHGFGLQAGQAYERVGYGRSQFHGFSAQGEREEGVAGRTAGECEKGVFQVQEGNRPSESTKGEREMIDTEKTLKELGLSLDDVTIEDKSRVVEKPKPLPAPAFHGPTKAPKWDVKNEQPIHRAMAYMYASGKSRKEIAAATGYTEQAVTAIKNQPWFLPLVAEIQQRSGQASVENLFQAEVANTIQALIELRDDPNTPKAVKLGSIREILDRAVGKPIAYVKTEKSEVSADPKAEYERLRKQIADQQKSLDMNLRTSTDAIQRN